MCVGSISGLEMCLMCCEEEGDIWNQSHELGLRTVQVCQCNFVMIAIRKPGLGWRRWRWQDVVLGGL